MKEHILTAIRIILFISVFAVIMYIMNCIFVQSNWASIDRWEQYSKKEVKVEGTGSLRRDQVILARSVPTVKGQTQKGGRCCF